MERKFLEELGLEKELIDKILDRHSSEIGTLKQAADALTTERDGLKGQLDAVNDEIKSFKDLDIDGIKKAATDWETKYNADTQALKDQLEATNYGFAVQQAVGGVKFTSESAKKAFIADLTAKKLPLQEGKLLGLDDFHKEYATNDPGAFATETDDKTPVFTRGSSKGNLTNESMDAMRSAMGLPPAKSE